MQMHCPSSLTSLKTASCLCKTAQTWREKPANRSDSVSFSGKSFRHGEKIRLHESVHDTTPRSKATSRKTRLKSAKKLYLSHRFFDEIRQIHSFFNVFRQNLQILCRNQARFAVTSLQVRSPGTQLTVRRENHLLAGQLPRKPRVLAPKFPQSKR